jgi:hypothetical protein
MVMNYVAYSNHYPNPSLVPLTNYPYHWRLDREENSDEADEMERLKAEQKRKEEEEKEKDLILA